VTIPVYLLNGIELFRIKENNYGVIRSIVRITAPEGFSVECSSLAFTSPKVAKRAISTYSFPSKPLFYSIIRRDYAIIFLSGQRQIMILDVGVIHLYGDR